jgi:hypothetical protein
MTSHAGSSPETLRSALKRAADDLHRHAPPASLPASVVAAVPTSLRARNPLARHRGWRFAWGGGALAGVTLMVAVAMLATAPRETPTDGEVSTAFMPLADSERWSQSMRDAREHGRAWVVPTELPSESLAAMGLPYDPSRAGEPVRAELLVHANGDVLAVRFVR